MQQVPESGGMVFAKLYHYARRQLSGESYNTLRFDWFNYESTPQPVHVGKDRVSSDVSYHTNIKVYRQFCFTKLVHSTRGLWQNIIYHAS